MQTRCSVIIQVNQVCTIELEFSVFQFLFCLRKQKLKFQTQLNETVRFVGQQSH